MRKLFLFALLMGFVVSVYAQSISNVRLVPSRAAYLSGENVRIYWNYSEISRTEKVKITLWREGGTQSTCLLADDVSISTASKSWRVSSTCSNPRTGVREDLLTGRVKIRVRWKRHPVWGESEYFEIRNSGITAGNTNVSQSESVVQSLGATPVVRVVFPNGGEELIRGRQYEIEWESVEGFGRPRIKIFKGNTKVKEFPPERVFPVKVGRTWKFSWIVDSDMDISREGHPDYRIRIEKGDCSGTYDESDSNFSIKTGGILVTSPSGSSPLTMSHRVLIRWRAGWSVREDEFMSIYLYNVTKNIRYPIRLGSGVRINRGVYEWIVGTFDERAHMDSFSPGSDRFKIMLEYGHHFTDVYSQEFRIIKPTIEVLSPEGETLHLGDTLTIRWRSSSNLHGRVNVELYNNCHRRSFTHFDTIGTNILRTSTTLTWRVYSPPSIWVTEMDPIPTNCRYRVVIKSAICPFITSPISEGSGGIFTLRD